MVKEGRSGPSDEEWIRLYGGNEYGEVFPFAGGGRGRKQSKKKTARGYIRDTAKEEREPENPELAREQEEASLGTHEPGKKGIVPVPSLNGFRF